ncbi:MAG: DUF3021 domain-containing protein [Christensenella sp.]|nr:DUF3021 domain-containing protein [Christensenella sp.]
MKKGIGLFFTVLGTAFVIALMITVIITVSLGQSAVPLTEIRNDVILAVVIACVQLIWVGSDKNNKTYIIRTIVHFVILLTGCTLLMLWFGWLPPGTYLLSYYVIFIVVYIVLWIVFWMANKKKWSKMNQKLDEYKKGIDKSKS